MSGEVEKDPAGPGSSASLGICRRTFLVGLALAPTAACAEAQDVYVAEGDSITTTDGHAAKWPTYPVIYQATRPSLKLVDIAQSSQDSSSWRGRKPESYKGGGRNFMSLLPGNDLDWKYVNSGGSRDSYLTTLAAYLDARRAAGMKVVLCSTLPRASGTFNKERTICNAAMAAWVGPHCDYYCDFSKHYIGTDAAALDKRYYFDGTHPTAFGQEQLASLIGPILDAVK